MREITIKLYQYDELTDDAKEKARQWYRTHFDFSFEQEAIIEDAKEIAALMGLNIDKVYYSGLMGLNIDKVYYSGFWSQGDGASFTGHYKYRKGALKAVKDYAPLDKELHRIAQELQNIQSKYFYKISCDITQSGNYQHENTMRFDFRLNWEYLYTTMAFEADISEALRDFARWIYNTLKNAYETQTEDEEVEESIRANEYEFTENGERA